MQRTIIWTNKAMEELCGLPAEEMIGRHCYEIVRGSMGLCPGCLAIEALRTGGFQEAERQTPDGRTWIVRSNPIKDANGRITGIVHASLDIKGLKNWGDEGSSSSLMRASSPEL